MFDDDAAFNFVPSLGTDQSAVVTLTYRQDGAPGTNVNAIEWGEDGKDMAKPSHGKHDGRGRTDEHRR